MLKAFHSAVMMASTCYTAMPVSIIIAIRSLEALNTANSTKNIRIEDIKAPKSDQCPFEDICDRKLLLALGGLAMRIG